MFVLKVIISKVESLSRDNIAHHQASLYTRFSRHYSTKSVSSVLIYTLFFVERSNNINCLAIQDTSGGPTMPGFEPTLCNRCQGAISSRNFSCVKISRPNLFFCTLKVLNSKWWFSWTTVAARKIYSYRGPTQGNSYTRTIIHWMYIKHHYENLIVLIFNIFTFLLKGLIIGQGRRGGFHRWYCWWRRQLRPTYHLWKLHSEAALPIHSHSS